MVLYFFILQIKELKSRLEDQQEKSEDDDVSLNNNNGETKQLKSEEKMMMGLSVEPTCETAIAEDLNYESFNKNGVVGGCTLFPPVDFNRDGASDSDSSAILNEDPVVGGSSSFKFNFSSSSFQFQKNCQSAQTTHHQYVKMEEHNFFSTDEACNFFSDDQAPTLQWCWS